MIVAARFQFHSRHKKEENNRVGGTGLIPVPTSHTTVRAVRHTAVP